MDDWMIRMAEVLPPRMDVETAAAIIKAAFRLTPKESHVAVQLLIDGTDEDISARLGGSPHTIKHHRSEIIAKLGVESCRAAAVKLSICLWKCAAA